MWHELYGKLTNWEKEEFKRLLNLVLSHTFIVRDLYDPKEGMMKVNSEYRFIERNFELFLEYLEFAGWSLDKDSNYGVISLRNIYDYNRLRLDRNTTMLLYTMRLIFEEEREKVALQHEILTTTGQIIHKLITLGLVKKKPSDKDLADAFRLLAYHNVIQKLEGTWEEAECKILILPSILFIVTNERISRIHEMMEDDNGETDFSSENAGNEESEEEVIRGGEEES
ncbi:MAG: DUF4194 domain-containing protein [Bacillota bacterium]|jgi:hypothetical protein